MPQNSVAGIDATVQQTNEWIQELCQELHTDDPQRAYLALRAFLHTARDQLTIEEVAQFAAQLPMLIRGIYYEGWDPTRNPARIRHRDEFLQRIGEEAIFPDLDPVRVISAVTRVLNRHMSPGQTEQLLHSMSHEIRELMTTVAGSHTG